MLTPLILDRCPVYWRDCKKTSCSRRRQKSAVSSR